VTLRRIVLAAMVLALFASVAGGPGTASMQIFAAPLAQEDADSVGAESESDASSVAGAGLASEGTLREVGPDEVAALAKTLNCPLCQGYSLQECPLEVCMQMRELIAQSLAEGKSPEAIRASFVEEYGPQVLNAPPAEGFFLSAWWTPVLVLLAGAVWLFARMRQSESLVDLPSARGSLVSADANEYAERIESLLRDGEET
jgi:cytochrome c-type biogenesis protein CcmH/NrfF